MCEGMMEDLDSYGASYGTKSYRVEKRILEYGGGLPSRYMINGVLQEYSPDFPNNTELIFNNTALIGYPDTINYVWGFSIGDNTEKFRYFSKTGMIIS